jgi:hypothetical protein
VAEGEGGIREIPLGYFSSIKIYCTTHMRQKAFALLIALFASPAWAQPALFASSCAEDSHIGEATRKALNSAAINFVDTFLGPDPSSGFAALSKEGQEGVTQEQFAAQARVIEQLQPSDLRTQHVYLLNIAGKSARRVICATDLKKPDGWESLATINVPEQAYVVMSAQARNNSLAVTIWLVPESTGWKVQSFWINASTLADQGPIQLWEMARRERDLGHKFNAVLLYAVAGQVANRGPNFQLGITQSISEDMAGLDVPAEIRGEAPFLWKDGSTTWKVLNVGPIAIGGKIYVVISHEVSSWQTNNQVDGWNKDLLAYVKNRFPEYSEVFAGLVARAHERGGNRGYGTVDEFTKNK